MKRILSSILVLVMVVSAFVMSGCVKEEDGYTKSEIDGFVNYLKDEISSKNELSTTKIESLKMVYEAKIALLEKADEDYKTELKTLTDDYNEKVAEVEAAILAAAEAFEIYRAEYEDKLALLIESDANNKEAIDSLSVAYNAKVTELNNKIIDNTNTLAAYKTAYEAKVAVINNMIAENVTEIEKLEAKFDSEILKIKNDTAKEISDINSLITQLQNADTSNQNAIKTLTEAYNAMMAELQELTDEYSAKIAELESQIDDLRPDHEHDFSLWRTYKECDSGMDFRTCSVCDYMEFRNSPKMAHEFDVEFSYDVLHHWLACKYCDAKKLCAEHKDDGNGYCSVCNKLMSTEGIIYSISLDGTYAEVLDYTGKSPYIRIEEKYNGLPVKSIRDSAFFGCDFIIDVIIPDSITEIGSNAFYNCSNLVSITLGSGITTIGSSAFGGNCIRLVEVINRSSLPITSGTQDYGGIAYRAKAVHNGKSRIISKDDYLFYSFATENLLVSYIGKDRILTLPSDINGQSYNINDYAFYFGNMYSVVIPDGVSVIGRSAFEECQSLMRVTIPSTVTEIGFNAFIGCIKLNEVINHSSILIVKGTEDNGYIAYHALEVHDGDSKIKEQGDYWFYTFDDINYLIGYVGEDTVLTLPTDFYGQAYELKANAFNGNRDITEVTIPEGVKEVSKFAFYRCQKLTKMTIPDSVTSFCDYALEACDNLVTIIYDGKMEQWSDISKGYNWNERTGDYVVICTDGTLTKEEN